MDLAPWRSCFLVTAIMVCLARQADGDIRLVESIDYNPEWLSSWLYQGIPNATEYYVLTNPGFPFTACSAFTHIMQEVQEYKFYLVMIDYDLPVNTTLQFWVGPWSTVSWTVWQGHLLRLVRSAKGYLKVVYAPPADCEEDGHIGFKVLVWYGPRVADDRAWRPRPLPRCPWLESVELGTEVVVGRGIPSTPGDAFHDCIWQLKAPVFPLSREQWVVYTRVTDMYVNGTVEIREGTHSEGYLLASNGVYFPNSYFIGSLNQPAEGFTSNEGIYIRLIKPYWEGNFTFVYGYFTYEETLPPKCYQHIANSTFQKGFMCAESSWCIPQQHTCNNVRNCADGSDEAITVCGRDPQPAEPVYISHANTQEFPLLYRILGTIIWSVFTYRDIVL